LRTPPLLFATVTILGRAETVAGGAGVEAVAESLT
jgi:hypothetical protein